MRFTQDVLEVSAGLASTRAFNASQLAQLIRRVTELRQQPVGRLSRWAKMVLVSWMLSTVVGWGSSIWC